MATLWSLVATGIARSCLRRDWTHVDWSCGWCNWTQRGWQSFHFESTVKKCRAFKSTFQSNTKVCKLVQTGQRMQRSSVCEALSISLVQEWNWAHGTFHMEARGVSCGARKSVSLWKFLRLPRIFSPGLGLFRVCVPSSLRCLLFCCRLLMLLPPLLLAWSGTLHRWSSVFKPFACVNNKVLSTVPFGRQTARKDRFLHAVQADFGFFFLTESPSCEGLGEGRVATRTSLGMPRGGSC